MTDYRFEGLGKEWVTIEAAELDALRERAEKLQAQAGAWCQVFDALRELVPEFTDMAPSGVGCALAAIRGLRERAEKAEAERDDAIRKLGIAIGYREGHPDMCCGKCSDLLAEAREDIKALTFALRVDEGMQLESSPFRDQFKAVWQRIRDRKLLEVSDGE